MNKYVRLSILLALLLCARFTNAQETSPSKSLAIAARAMDQYLRTLEPATQTQWKQQFAWDQWGPVLAQEQMPDREVLQTALPKFYGFQEGLDQSEFLRMRAELKSFLHGNDPPTPIGVFPSLYLRVDKALVDSRLEKRSATLESHRPTGNYIAGAWVTGQADCLVDVKSKLIDFQNQAAVEIRLSGTVNAPHTVASERRFQVHGSANTQMEGVAYLLLDQGKFRATQPQVFARTESQLSYVDGPRPFRRIAMRQARKRQAQGELEGAEITRSTVQTEFERQLALETARLNDQFSDYAKLWSLLKRVDIAPSEVTTALRHDMLELGLRFTDSGADSARDAKSPPEGDSMEIAMHDTFLSAYPRRFLKGVWWTEKDFEQLRKELAGLPLAPTANDASLERWSARWDSREPFTTLITPEYVECKLTFSHAGASDQWVKEGIVVSAKFQPITAGAQIALRRVGEVYVEARSPNIELTTEQEEFFRRQFTNVCGDAIPLEHLNPLAGVSASALSLLTTTNVSLDPGWLSIKYRKAEGILAKALSASQQKSAAQK